MIDKRKFYINGTWINPIIKNDFEVINPSNEQPYAVISLGSKKDVDLAVNTAKKAFITWSQVDKKEKISLLENLLKIYKNISLLEWTINQAKKVYECEKIIVSTEDFELKSIAKELNVRVVNRPADLAKDKSSTLSVIDHLFEIFESEEMILDSFTILQVTSPLRDSKHIKNSLELINSNKYDSVLSVYIDDKHPAKNYFYNNGFLEPVIPNYEFLPRQLLPVVYRRNGAIFSVTRNFYKKN